MIGLSYEEEGLLRKYIRDSIRRELKATYSGGVKFSVLICETITAEFRDMVEEEANNVAEEV